MISKRCYVYQFDYSRDSMHRKHNDVVEEKRFTLGRKRVV